jgi:arylsulfatase A-like enzyme
VGQPTIKKIMKQILLLIPAIIFSCARKEKQPNFVFILVDDLGWADVQCNFPGSFYETPNIDRMAEEGIRFTQAYSAHPVCSPTRASLMTGKHPNRMGITDWIPGHNPTDRPLLGPQINHELGLEEITLAEKLKEYGYNTFFAGKWHLGEEGFFPENQGFDINIGGHHRGSPPGGYYSPYNNPKLSDGPEGEYLPDRLTNESISFLKENRDEPFFLYLSFYTVHTPIQAAISHHDSFVRKRENLGLSSDIPHQEEGEGWTKLIQENAAYASMVAAMDENVGRILQTLKETGLDENTWVIFTSDNGGLSTRYGQNSPTSNFPLRAGKGWLYEGGIRVPLVINGPDIYKPGRINDQPVVSMDFFTTILNIAGVDHQRHDGENLLPIIIDNKAIDRDILFFHYPHYHGSAWKPGSSIRKGDWKLVYFYEDERSELFNLAADPGEMVNIAATYPEKAAELKKILDEKLLETNARFPQPNPDFTTQ